MTEIFRRIHLPLSSQLLVATRKSLSHKRYEETGSAHDHGSSPRKGTLEPGETEYEKSDIAPSRRTNAVHSRQLPAMCVDCAQHEDPRRLEENARQYNVNDIESILHLLTT